MIIWTLTRWVVWTLVKWIAGAAFWAIFKWVWKKAGGWNIWGPDDQ